jgi:hypothetical protein
MQRLEHRSTSNQEGFSNEFVNGNTTKQNQNVGFSVRAGRRARLRAGGGLAG